MPQAYRLSLAPAVDFRVPHFFFLPCPLSFCFALGSGPTTHISWCNAVGNMLSVCALHSSPNSLLAGQLCFESRLPSEPTVSSSVFSHAGTVHSSSCVCKAHSECTSCVALHLDRYAVRTDVGCSTLCCVETVQHKNQYLPVASQMQVCCSLRPLFSLVSGFWA